MLTLPVPERGSGLGLPPDASVDGHQVDALIGTTTVGILLLFLIVVGWLVWSIVRHHRGRTAVYEHRTRSGQLLVAICVAILALEDGQLFVRSVLGLNQVFWNFERVNRMPGVVRIELNAHQWSWDFRYPGPDGDFNTRDDVVVLNHLRVPVGTPVLLQMASTDVVHGFSLPNFRIKQDVVPGRITKLWFRARRTGHFAIACQQHCGTHHYKMKGVVTVMSRADYDAWLARAVEDARRAYDPKDLQGHWGWDFQRQM